MGENKPGRSFVGIAFNVQNDSTFEGIYFRPFNFMHKEKINREHSVQYIFHPNYTWNVLRNEHEGIYEAAFINPPSPNDWFTIRLVISSKELIVFSKSSGDLLLKVNRLCSPTSSTVALWTGHNSKGGFRNLVIGKK